VQIQALALQERADSAWRNASIEAGDFTNDLRARLGSVGLPGALEAYKERKNGSNSAIPEVCLSLCMSLSLSL